jgi:hypothetical protein
MRSTVVSFDGQWYAVCCGTYGALQDAAADWALLSGGKKA